MNTASTGVDANPEALNAIIKASESYSIVASQDIVDVNGLKLLAKGQQVSASLQQRLLERKLRHPLEVCLQAEDGVTLFSLLKDMNAYLEEDTAVSRAMRPWAAKLQEQLQGLPLHSVAQLLLTTAKATRPSSLPHAVQAMTMAGAMACAGGQREVVDIRLAMLGGLLHDIGEVYIQPSYLDYSNTLDLVGHKHMVVHPRVAQMLLRNMTDYPEALSRAIGEHHERLDGSGYPARLTADKISPLGRMLAVVEVALGIMRNPIAPLTRASFGLRVVPGEFDSKWTGLVCSAASAAKEEVPSEPVGLSEKDFPLEEIERHFQIAMALGKSLKEQGAPVSTLEVVHMALTRLTRLRVAWNALGMWGVKSEELSKPEEFDLQMASRELQQRLRDLKRECLLVAERLGEKESAKLAILWQGLLDETTPEAPVAA